MSATLEGETATDQLLTTALTKVNQTLDAKPLWCLYPVMFVIPSIQQLQYIFFSHYMLQVVFQGTGPLLPANGAVTTYWQTSLAAKF